MSARPVGGAELGGEASEALAQPGWVEDLDGAAESGDLTGEGLDVVASELDLDTTGFIQGVENSEFKTPKELGRLLAESNACQRCIVKQLFRYAFGREETAADQPVIETSVAKFRDSGYRFKELIVAIVTSDLFLQKH